MREGANSVTCPILFLVMQLCDVCQLFCNFSLFLFKLIFGMAVMPFPCNAILLIQGNLPKTFPMSTLRQASFPIPYFKMELGMASFTLLTYLGGIE